MKYLNRFEHIMIGVTKLDTNGKFIQNYDAVIDAARDNNLHRSDVSNCCNGKRQSAGGFKWLYTHDYNLQNGGNDRLEKFNESLEVEDLPFREWQSNIKSMPTIPFNKEDTKAIDKLDKILKENPDYNLELKKFDGKIELNPIKLEKTLEPFVYIWKYNGLFLKMRSDMWRKNWGSYEGGRREFKIYRTSNLAEIIRSGLL